MSQAIRCGVHGPLSSQAYDYNAKAGKAPRSFACLQLRSLRPQTLAQERWRCRSLLLCYCAPQQPFAHIRSYEVRAIRQNATAL